MKKMIVIIGLMLVTGHMKATFGGKIVGKVKAFFGKGKKYELSSVAKDAKNHVVKSNTSKEQPVSPLKSAMKKNKTSSEDGNKHVRIEESFNTHHKTYAEDKYDRSYGMKKKKKKK